MQIFAAEDFYQFDSAQKQMRFHALTSQLRCLVCQNQNLNESNAPLAADLRQKIYEHLLKGQSDEEIKNYLVARYGNYILYRPPWDATTSALWLGPFFFMLFGLCYLLHYIYKRNRYVNATRKARGKNF